MSGIFNRIFRYRQREGRTPSEDYFTEVFVAVIERHDELGRALAAAWLNDLDASDIRSVSIKTQRKFSLMSIGVNRKPDIWMEAIDSSNERHWILVENKIDSAEGENQLKDYARILGEAQGLKSRTLVYITKYSSETSFCGDGTVSFRPLRWPEVYVFLQNELQDYTGDRELAVELLKLMEDWNMDGMLSAKHLRAAVICFDSGIGGKLQELQDEAWVSSGIGAVIKNQMAGRWYWSYGRDRGEQYANEIPKYGIKLWMGYRFNRRDEAWDVDKFELPSPVVTVSLAGTNKEVGERLSRPSEYWTGPVQGMAQDDKWVRQPEQGEIPQFGEPLDEYYRNFFHRAFVELKLALERIE